MNVSVLSKIENNISQLSLTEQLWLIERLIQRIRESTLNEQSILESQLTAMAADPEIQNELQQIEAEFALAEADGLGIA